MNLRSAISIVLTLALLAAPIRSAHAQEMESSSNDSVDESAPSAPLVPLATERSAPDILALTANTLTLGSRFSSATMSKFDLVAKSPTDIRLSRGAKTAIIVTAIVVGVLIIVGVVAIAKPHRL